MNDLVLVSILWMALGAAWTYYTDKKAYNEGMVDAIVMHNKGQLTYTTYEDEDGATVIELEVKPDEG
jgi:hypothetical protein